MATLERAIAIAAEAHAGQTDKAGQPYILHPLRVMGSVTSDQARIAAVLHDVVEDSDWTLEALASAGFDPAVIHAVDALTRRDGESYEHFVERAGIDPIAREVKLRDLDDNMDLRRLSQVTPGDLKRWNRYRDAKTRLLAIQMEELFSRSLVEVLKSGEHTRWFVSRIGADRIPLLLWAVGRFAEEACRCGCDVREDAIFYPGGVAEPRMRGALAGLVAIHDSGTRDQAASWASRDLPDASPASRHELWAGRLSDESVAWGFSLQEHHLLALLFWIGQYGSCVDSSKGPWSDVYPAPLLPTAGEPEAMM